MAADVLVVNTGSSSVKYRLLDADTHRRKAGGTIERTDGIDAVGEALAAEPALADAPLVAVGHRVVHGGEHFAGPVVIDRGVLAGIRDLAPLAPLHIPANLAGIQVARQAFSAVPHVAVFDTAFHQTLPPQAHTYAVPRLWREHFGVRRYGFHGISYQYVSRRAAALLGRDPGEANLIVLHLGNGASACAIEAGRSVETSMGMTPLEGLVMGTRSGDVDPALPGYLARVADLGAEDVEAALNRDSGLLALAGSNDLRDVWAAVDRGDADARLAIEVYCHRIRMYVGAYYALLGRVDAVVFTAGVGERDPRVRELSLTGLDRLGIAVDPVRNADTVHGEGFISPDATDVPVLVVPTDEESEIAAQALACVRTLAATR